MNPPSRPSTALWSAVCMIQNISNYYLLKDLAFVFNRLRRVMFHRLPCGRQIYQKDNKYPPGNNLQIIKHSQNL